MSLDVAVTFFMFCIGACVGSFLNVCVVRLPHERSIVLPASHCVHCRHPLPWYDNIPLLSYWILGGRCRFCQKKFSIRYFIVELITAMSFVIFYQHFGLQWALLPYLVMLSCMVVVTFVDFEHRIIPDEISIGGAIAGLIFSLLIPQLHLFEPVAGPWYMAHLKSFGFSLLGALVGGGSIYVMGIIGDFIFKKESMGGGDVKLMAMVGAFLGWKAALLAFFIAPFFGAIFGVVEKIRTKDSAIAYGPFLCLGALISLFYGNAIVDWLLAGGFFVHSY